MVLRVSADWGRCPGKNGRDDQTQLGESKSVGGKNGGFLMSFLLSDLERVLSYGPGASS